MADLDLVPPPYLARPDLAEQALEGLVRADAYRRTRPMHGRPPVADIRSDADPASPRVDQLLHGEAFDVLDEQGGRLLGRNRRDGVVGWMDATDLAPGAPRPRGRVAAIGQGLPLNALVQEGGVDAGVFETDPVLIAERLIGTPHELGARSSFSTDCSGLVQQALLACGHAGPRRADQQAELGEAIGREEARRGDLVIWLHPTGGAGWTGHSAFMLDENRVLHASGDRGGVVVEAFAEADARCRAGGFGLPVFRRL